MPKKPPCARGTEENPYTGYCIKTCAANQARQSNPPYSCTQKEATRLTNLAIQRDLVVQMAATERARVAAREAIQAKEKIEKEAREKIAKINADVAEKTRVAKEKTDKIAADAEISRKKHIEDARVAKEKTDKIAADAEISRKKLIEDSRVAKEKTDKIAADAEISRQKLREDARVAAEDAARSRDASLKEARENARVESERIVAEHAAAMQESRDRILQAQQEAKDNQAQIEAAERNRIEAEAAERLRLASETHAEQIEQARVREENARREIGVIQEERVQDQADAEISAQEQAQIISNHERQAELDRIGRNAVVQENRRLQRILQAARARQNQNNTDTLARDRAARERREQAQRDAQEAERIAEEMRVRGRVAWARLQEWYDLEIEAERRNDNTRAYRGREEARAEASRLRVRELVESRVRDAANLEISERMEAMGIAFENSEAERVVLVQENSEILAELRRLAIEDPELLELIDGEAEEAADMMEVMNAANNEILDEQRRRQAIEDANNME